MVARTHHWIYGYALGRNDTRTQIADGFFSASINLSPCRCIVNRYQTMVVAGMGPGGLRNRQSGAFPAEAEIQYIDLQGGRIRTNAGTTRPNRVRAAMRHCAPGWRVCKIGNYREREP